jgi:hypothetical protein
VSFAGLYPVVFVRAALSERAEVNLMQGAACPNWAGIPVSN